MKARGFWKGAGVAAVAAAMAAAALAGGDAPKPDVRRTQARVARGKYLVDFGSCSDCHTPKIWTDGQPADDPARRLSGHPETNKVVDAPPLPAPWIAATNPDFTAWAGPWGISYAMNLTPDENTGIGSWSEETFIKAVKTGKHMGVSRPILPPMPWPSFRNLTDEDLKSIYAYLRSIPAVQNRVPDPVPPAAPPAAAPTK